MRAKQEVFYSKWIRDEIYHRHFWLLVGDKEKANKFLVEKLKMNMQIKLTGSGCLGWDDNRTFLYVRNPKDEFSHFIHELTHLVIRNLTEIDLPINLETTEAVAYYTQYLYDLVFNQYLSKKIKMRIYNPPHPNPIAEPEEFNQYLRDHNTIVSENDLWILIKSSFEKDELVCFAKFISEKFYDLDSVDFECLQGILEPFQDSKWYINKKTDKSVDRFHIHIVL